MTDLVDQYLLVRDLLGFIIAQYTQRIGVTFYVLVMLMVMVPLYMRTQSLVYVSVLWLLFGGLMISTLPAYGFPLGWILLVLGITGLLWKTFR